MKAYRKPAGWLIVGMLVILVTPSPASAQQRVRPYQISPDSRLPALSNDNMRLVPPTPEARVTDERQRPERRRLSGSTASRADEQPTPAVANPTSGTFRRAPGPQADPGVPPEYGRLIVVTGFDVAEVLIEGELYPRASLQGVLLWAGYQYEVVIQGEGSSSEVSSSNSSRSSRTSAAASTATGSSRTITVRLRPGETRVLMANLGEGGTPVVARSSSSRSSRARDRSVRDSEDDDEDETGYLGVSSTPRGTVYIDGDNIGQTTPARRIELEPGRHEVRIFYDSEDRFSETKNVLIRAGVNTNVFFRLRRDEPEDDDED